MSLNSFSSAVADWSKKAEGRNTDIFHESLRQLDQELADNTPVKTGNLRNSRAASGLAPIAVDWKTKKFRDPSDAINNAIAGTEVGNSAWLGYRAPYAHKIERLKPFLRMAAQRWKQIVARAAASI